MNKHSSDDSSKLRQIEKIVDEYFDNLRYYGRDETSRAAAPHALAKIESILEQRVQKPSLELKK